MFAANGVTCNEAAIIAARRVVVILRRLPFFPDQPDFLSISPTFPEPYYRIEAVIRSRCSLMALLIPVCAMADAIDEPLQLPNRQPLAQLHGLQPLRSAEVLADGVTSWRAAVDIANNFVRDETVHESLVLDGESQRYELNFRRGLGAGLEIGVTLPWISYNGGIADNFIEDWHDGFGLPDGDRPAFAARQLQFRYRRDGRELLAFERAESGIGDIQIHAVYRVAQRERSAVALLGAVTLPSGDADKLTGSGEPGAAVALALTRNHPFDAPLTWTANIGAQWLPRGAVLGREQKQAVWFAATELSWAVARDWRLKAQLQAHSALYASDLTALGSDSLQLLLGGSLRLSERWLLDAAIGEDIAVDTAPDVTFQLALRTSY